MQGFWRCERSLVAANEKLPNAVVVGLKVNALLCLAPPLSPLTWRLASMASRHSRDVDVETAALVTAGGAEIKPRDQKIRVREPIFSELM
jgi:hypothetical protein